MKVYNPYEIAPPMANYSQGIEVGPAGQHLHVGGLVGIAQDGSVPERFIDQVRICFQSLTYVLAEAKMNRSHIIHIRSYLTDKAQLAAYRSARDAFFYDLEPLPTATLLFVNGLAQENLQVCVEVTAFKPATE